MFIVPVVGFGVPKDNPVFGGVAIMYFRSVAVPTVSHREIKLDD